MNLTNPLIRIQNLTKKFGRTTALDNVSFEAGSGHIIGLLGANGAGKSTLLRHIIGLYLPDGGSCVTLGRSAGDLGEAELAQIGYVHQEIELIDWMKGAQFLRYIRAYYPKWNNELEYKLTTKFEVDLSQRIAVMSPGNRQKLAIVAAVCFEPRLLLLDEPAAGLDPIARADLMEFLLDLIQNPDRTILISSHILSDIEKVVDHVLMMRQGKLIRDCSLDTLREDYCQVKLTALQGSLPDTLTFAGVMEEKRNGQMALLKVRGQSKENLIGRAREMGCSADISPLSLDEIYRLEMQK